MQGSSTMASELRGECMRTGQGDEGAVAPRTCVSVHGVLRKFEGEKALELTLRTGVLVLSASVCG